MATKSNNKKRNGNSANLGFEAELWAAADALRNNMDAAEYKHVVLGLVFLKYISDAFEERHGELLAEETQGADPEDPDEYRATNVFWVPVEARWNTLKDSARQPAIGKIVDDAMTAIERDNPTLKGVLPKDYARPGLDKGRLGQLIDLISNIGLGDAESRAQDVLGRVYEYFLSEFASAEGKKGGQFYTPRCVVQLLVSMIAPYKGRVYDPCCGSGGMFVQSERFVKEHGGRRGQISVFGQESNPTTWRLAKMNLAIRGIDNNLGSENADSFHRDLHPDLKADYILANPPFNDSDWRGEQLKGDKRWKYGIPPVSNANFAWVQHFVSHLAPNGTAGFVLAQASLSSESAIETDIRRGLVEDGLVACLVTIPDKLFYSTPIPVCLWILSRASSGASSRRRGDILMIDASALGVAETRTHSTLPDQAIAQVADTFHAWRDGASTYADVPGFCRAVPVDDIRAAGYSLFPARYIASGHVELRRSAQTNRDSITRLETEYDAWEQDLANKLRLIQHSLDELRSANPRSAHPKLIRMKLHEVLERSDARLANATEPEILTCTERAGLILQRERFAKRVATDNTSKYKLVYRTDIVYNPYLLWAGAIDQCWVVDVGITSPAYEVLRLRKGFDPTLVGCVIKSPRMKSAFDGISVGTVTRRRRAPVERFLELEVELPSIEDQARFSAVSVALQDGLGSMRSGVKLAGDLLQNLSRQLLGLGEST